MQHRSVLKWFASLLLNLVYRFTNLSFKFLSRFANCKFKPKSIAIPLGFHQESGDSLRDYLNRINKEALLVKNLSFRTIMLTLMHRLDAAQKDSYIESHEEYF